MPAEREERIAAGMARMADHPFKGDKQIHQLVELFLARVLTRADSIRAAVGRGGETKQ